MQKLFPVILLFAFLTTGAAAQTHREWKALWYEAPSLTDSLRVAANPTPTKPDTIGYITGTTDTIRTSIFNLGGFATITPTLSDTAGTDSAAVKFLLYGAQRTQSRRRNAPADASFRLVDTQTGITEVNTIWNLHSSTYPVYEWWYIIVVGETGNKLASAVSVEIEIATVFWEPD